MGLLIEALLAGLCAAGLAFFAWWLFGRVLRPLPGQGVCALLPGRGDGEGLEQSVRAFVWLLVEHRGQTLTREQLLDRVWDSGEFVDENALSVAVRRLRTKLTDAPIRTVYGVGYIWEVRQL